MSGLLGDVSRGMRDLVREEIRIARDEVSEKALDFAGDAGMVAGGGLIAYAGALTLLGSAVDGLRKMGLPRWFGALIVGFAAIGGGIGMIMKGLDNLKLKDPIVDETKDEVHDTVEVISRKVS